MRLKRLGMGALIVLIFVSTAATVCLADISGPRWPEVMSGRAQD
jgi:hypothetical protein